METQHRVAIGVAVASLVLVPLLRAGLVRLWDAWREARHARLAKMFVPREELDMHLREIVEQQAKQHKENRDFLDTIRGEAQKREGTIVATIQEADRRQQLEAQRLGGDISKIHSRVDNLFTKLAEIRRQ